jgi:hypothetical protein
MKKNGGMREAAMETGRDDNARVVVAARDANKMCCSVCAGESRRQEGIKVVRDAAGLLLDNPG